nr:TetR family transcriptional regulator [uncultured Enterobacter sp.]
MAKKTKEDALKTRQQLIDAAILTFSQRGFSNTSLDDIAHAAQVTRGAIYWHFTNKTELFNAIWQQQLPLKEKLSRKDTLQFKDNPIRLFRYSLIEGLRLIADDPLEQALIEILYHKCEFTKEMTPEADIRERLFFNHDSVDALLEKCLIQDPLFCSSNRELALIIIQAYMSGIVKNWLMLNKNFDLSRLAPQLVEGLLTLLRVTPDANASSIKASHSAPAESIISP